MTGSIRPNRKPYLNVIISGITFDFVEQRNKVVGPNFLK